MKRDKLLYEISNIIHLHRRATVAVSSVELAEIILKVIEQYQFEDRFLDLLEKK